MVGNNIIFESIDNNHNLSPEVKENFKDLVQTYMIYFPNVDKETLAKNMLNLKIEQVNKYLIDEPIKYANNTLMIKKDDLQKDYDYRYLLMREVIKMQSHKDSTKLQKNNSFDAIYEGYSSICANMVVGNQGSLNLYEDEMITVNLLGNIVGTDAFDDLIIKNNDKTLLNNLQKSGVNISDFMELSHKMNYNMKAENIERNQSMLGEIQVKLINMFFKTDRTLEEVERFKSNLFGNHNIFDNKNKYPNLNNVYIIYENIVNNMEFEKTNMKTR